MSEAWWSFFRRGWFGADAVWELQTEMHPQRWPRLGQGQAALLGRRERDQGDSQALRATSQPCCSGWPGVPAPLLRGAAVTSHGCGLALHQPGPPGSPPPLPLLPRLTLIFRKSLPQSQELPSRRDDTVLVTPAAVQHPTGILPASHPPASQHIPEHPTHISPASQHILAHPNASGCQA